MNLLPQELKEAIQSDYRKRVLLVALLFVFILIVVSIVLLVPSYLIFSAKKASVAKSLEFAKARSAAQAVSESYDEIADINKKIGVLLVKEKKVPESASVIIASVIEVGRDKVALTDIALNRGTTMTLAGIAETRSSLITFKEALEQNEHFSRVDSPISNLLADKDINFSFTVTLK